jgi:hypothetical protein
VAFAAPPGAMLVVATDGLWSYASGARIAAVAADATLAAIPGRLIELVRLRSGALPDDVAVVVVR